MHGRNCGDGEVIYRIGGEGTAAYRVRTGAVIIQHRGPGGSLREDRLGSGGVFGHAALLAGTDHDETALAAGEVVLDVIRGEDIGTALRHQPHVTSALLSASFGQSAAAGDAPVDPPWIPTIARLHAMEPDIAGQIGEAGLEINWLPFVVGRTERKPSDGGAPGVDLELNDKRPFNPSR